MEDATSAEQMLGQRIRDLRGLMGWSQKHLAEQMRSHGYKWQQTTVAKLETAGRPIRVNEAAAVAATFGVPLAALLGGPGVPAVPEPAKQRDAERRRVERTIRERVAAEILSKIPANREGK